MGFLSSMDISASGLTANRMRMDTISQNLANANTTRTADGGVYRRRVTVFTERKSSTFGWYYRNAKSATRGHGVSATAIVDDTTDLKVVYDPTHPDADAEGYVTYPNVDELVEMVDMMAASRAYEANVTALNAAKAMATKALEIGR
ncbi:flagellar basal body rod protein FlgC [Eubacteriales bacterium OttesenSCG-928-M02]|nr:flagellar basal body rod protein FlgC [Eubacteriales bacterium OttesenSCG-928-M02]